jgi:hypothetical protein
MKMPTPVSAPETRKVCGFVTVGGRTQPVNCQDVPRKSEADTDTAGVEQETAVDLSAASAQLNGLCAGTGLGATCFDPGVTAPVATAPNVSQCQP